MALTKKLLIFLLYLSFFSTMAVSAKADFQYCIDVSIESSVEIPENYSHRLELDATNINYSEFETDGSFLE